MLNINMLMDLGNGKSVVGAPGLFTPADKAKVEELWNRPTLTGADISFIGDIQGYTTTDTVGNTFAILSVPELENMRVTIEELQAKVEELSSAVSAETLMEMSGRLDELAANLEALDTTDRLNALEASVDALDNGSEITDRLNMIEASMDAYSEEQRNYIRSIDYSTVDGALKFVDGWADAVFTVGSATYETVGE